DLAAVRADGQSPVLWDAPFGDVHLGHDLQPAHHTVVDVARGAHHLVQHAVDTEPHQQVQLVGLQVDVAGPVLDSLGDQQVHELDNGGIFDDLMQRIQVRLVIVGVHRRGE